MTHIKSTPALKRLFDVIAAAMLIVLSSWILLLIMIAYLVSGNMPVFFKHPRVGKNEKIFDLLKFRTLDPVTRNPFPLGTFLRATSLDELPQLFQVLRGKLSLIGPRPLPVEYLPLYSAEQRKRHDVLPGITGLAQVSGRHSIAWKRKFELDVYYVQHWSLLLDIHILLKTIFIVFSFKRDVSLEEQKFQGKD